MFSLDWASGWIGSANGSAVGSGDSVVVSLDVLHDLSQLWHIRWDSTYLG